MNIKISKNINIKLIPNVLKTLGFTLLCVFVYLILFRFDYSYHLFPQNHLYIRLMSDINGMNAYNALNLSIFYSISITYKYISFLALGIYFLFIGFKIKNNKSVINLLIVIPLIFFVLRFIFNFFNIWDFYNLFLFKYEEIIYILIMIFILVFGTVKVKNTSDNDNFIKLKILFCISIFFFFMIFDFLSEKKYAETLKKEKEIIEFVEKKVLNIKVGIDKEKVIDLLGEPYRKEVASPEKYTLKYIAFCGSTENKIYLMSKNRNYEIRTYDFIFENNKVIEVIMPNLGGDFIHPWKKKFDNPWGN
jgi:hypothetical protein